MGGDNRCETVPVVTNTHIVIGEKKTELIRELGGAN
jgi:hypothetical protein